MLVYTFNCSRSHNDSRNERINKQPEEEEVGTYFCILSRNNLTVNADRILKLK